MASSLVSVSLSPSPVFLSPSKTLKPRNLTLLRSTQSDSPPSVDKFWQWLTDQGIVSDKSPARPGLVQEGLGLIAQRDISRNEVVLEIPKRFWINLDTVSNSEIGNVCGGLKPWVSVALFLIREKKKMGGSKWRNYIGILPEATNSTIYWSDEELAEIQGTQLLSSTLAVKDYIKREFLKVQEEVILPNKRLFPFPTTFDDFLWAFGILKSRAFSRLRGQNLVLVPLADLINHNPTITTEDYAYEIKGAGLFSRDLLFSLRCPVSVKAGEQVLIQYDLGKSNAELALDYGFIETRSDRNAYTLTLQIAESDPFFGDKVDVAETNGLGQTACFEIVLGRALPPKMLPYMRLVVLSGTDVFLLESIFKKAIWGHLESPFSRANEELVSRVVRDTCKSAISGYHTAIEEDENLHEGGNLGPKLEIAVGIRAGEKKVLQQIVGIFKQRELELDEMEYYQERRLRELGLVGEQGDIIFWEPK